MMSITAKQWIGYEQSASGTVNTMYKDQQELHSFHEATAGETDAAVKKAASAFPLYAALSGEERAAFLEKIAVHIEATGDELIGITQQETGLAEARLKGERQRTINQLRLFAQLLREGSWVKAIIDTPQEKGKPDIRQMQIPIGVAAIFGASNFPYAFSVAGGDTVSALAAGCPVVHKANPAHPATAEKIGACILQAAKDTHMPEGVFSLLHGAGHQVGIDLVMHQMVKAVGFTGSFKGGRALFDMAMKRPEPIPVYAEMGSVNPVFLLPGILAQQGGFVAQQLAASNTLGVGQFCTNPGLIIAIRSGITDNFISGFVEAIGKTTGQTMLTDNICANYCKGVGVMGALHGVDTLLASTTDNTGPRAVPYVFAVSGDDFLANSELQEEIFGPASLLVLANDRQQMLEIAGQLNGQLTASVWADESDLAEYSPLFSTLQFRAGRVICNGIPTGVEVNHSMVHGGPFPATTDSRTTSVGTQAIYRFTRPVCFQDLPQTMLPNILRNANPAGVWRQVNGKMTNQPL